MKILILALMLLFPSISFAQVGPTQLTSGSDTVDATSFSTASVSPTGNRLLLLSIASSAATTPAAPAITGNGLTWVQVASVPLGSNRTLTTFRSMGASPSSGVITIDFSGATQTGCQWSLQEFSNVDTTGTNGSGAVVQSATNFALGTPTTITATLAAFSDVDNVTFGTFMLGTAQTLTPGSGFTSLSDTTTAAPNTSLMVEWQAANDTTVDASFTNSQVAVIAIEIKEGSAPPPTTSSSGLLTLGCCEMPQNER